MNLQYLEGIPGWSMSDGKVVFQKGEDITGAGSIALEAVLNNNIEAFRITGKHSLGLPEFLKQLRGHSPKLIKGQVIGPVTFLTSHTTEDGRRLIQDNLYRELVPKILNSKARYQLDEYKRLQPGKEYVIFFDEPILAEIGSAVTSITHEQVMELLSGAVSELDAYTGVHICGNSDWDFILTLPIDIVNFDAFSFGEQFFLYRHRIKQFIERGGYIALGVVPTDSELLKNNSEQTVFDLAMSHLNKLAEICGRDKVRERVFITPSCGMGALTEAEAGAVLKMVSSLSGKVRNTYL